MATKGLLPVQFTVPVQVRKDLRRLAIDISEAVVPGSEIEYTKMCAYAAYYLLSVDSREVIRVVQAGMKHEPAYGPTRKQGKKASASTPDLGVDPLPNVKLSPTVMEKGGKPQDGGSEGLDGKDKPAGKLGRVPRKK